MDAQIEHLDAEAYLGHLEGDCPYLPGRESNLRFVNGHSIKHLYRDLLDEGYRRHGSLAYRPECPGCRACQLIRVPVTEFRRSKSQRRVWNKGRRLFIVSLAAPAYTEEKAALYQRYLAFQHGKGDPALEADRYEEFFVDSFLGEETMEIQLHAGDQLVGVGILDRIGNALSSVYFYFDPDWAEVSPGTYSALAEIEMAKNQGFTYYYLGYYIADCKTMNYKTNYRPCQIRTIGEENWETQD
jgi:arginine-tRNA-protein transferase